MSDFDDEDTQRDVDALRETDRRANHADAIFGTLGFLWNFCWIVAAIFGGIYLVVKFVQWAWAN